MKRSDIANAYVRIRKVDSTIPDDVLGFMYQVALKEFDRLVEEEKRARDDATVAECDIKSDMCELLKKKIDTNELRVRHYVLFHNLGIVTYFDLVRHTEWDLRRFNFGFGKKSMVELKEHLEKLNLHLGMFPLCED
jgi:DNA-directed RNA polymerase alpha subunit